MAEREASTAGGESDMAVAWKVAEAEGSRGRKIAVTGAALATADQELENNRALAAPAKLPDVEAQFKAFRAPAGAKADDVDTSPPEGIIDERPVNPLETTTLYTPPHETPREQRPRPQERQAAPEPEAEPEPARAAPPKSDEDLEYERRVLGMNDGASDLDELPDTVVRVGDREIPLSRIRDGLKAAKEKEEWQRALTQKSQASAEAVRTVMREAAQGYVSDPIGSLRRLGASDQQINDTLARYGYAPVGAASASSATSPTIPEDADPLVKQAFAKNAQLEQAVTRTSAELQRLREEREAERQAAQQQEAVRINSAILSGVKSDLLASARRMPSMREADGKPTPTARVLVDSVMLRLENEGRGRVLDLDDARTRAIQLFGATAREHGITPKAEQARRAIERPRAAVPTRPGTTVPLARTPGATPSGAAQPQRFDWTDDDQRRRAMRQYAVKLEEDLAAGT